MSNNIIIEENLTDISNKIFRIFETKFQILTNNLVSLLTGKVDQQHQQSLGYNQVQSNKRPIDKISVKKSGEEWSKVIKKGKGDDDDSPLPSVDEVITTPDGKRAEGESSCADMESCSSGDEQLSGGT